MSTTGVDPLSGIHVGPFPYGNEDETLENAYPVDGRSATIVKIRSSFSYLKFSISLGTYVENYMQNIFDIRFPTAELDKDTNHNI